MRYLSADIIYSLHREPIRQGVLVLNTQGQIIDLLESREGIDKLEIYKGFLCPGFVNTHCHLELSHLFGKLPEKKGLPDFISRVPKYRKARSSDIQESITRADAQMHSNGIVAVVDISNTSDTFKIKSKSPIHYHTFIELFTTDESKVDSVFSNGLELKKKCKTSASLVPHASYSVAQKLLHKIRDNNVGELISIHNQETSSEDELFEKGSGKLQQQIQAFGSLYISGKSALKTTLPKLPKAPTLLVHNTYTSIDDVQWAESQKNNLYWCTCPNANLYIEGVLPNYNIFQYSKMTIGTDSLASNYTLSIWDEVQTIRKYTDLDLHTLLTWACKNGAEFLQLDNLGTFEKGKKPGVCWVNEAARVKRLA